MNEWEWGLLEERVAPESVRISGVEVRKGDRVRLRPRCGADILDLALTGRIAVVEALEQDYEGRLQVAVVLDDDPGKDFGFMRQPGHRFFFATEEIEPAGPTPRVLVAGIGNVFLGDDAFGVEVVRRLTRSPDNSFPENVVVKDFGIRGYDLAYALLDPHDFVILVDAAPRGGEPGSVYVIEPDLNEIQNAEDVRPAIDAHALNPVNVLRMAQAMGPVPARILLVACEPEDLGGDEGRMELSPAVSAAVDGAVDLIGRMIKKILEGGKPEDLFPGQ